MLKVAVPSNTSDSNSSSSSSRSNSITSKPGDVDADASRSGGRVRKKKRRWSVCAAKAKVKAGALKVKAFVTSDSSSSSSESESADEGDRESNSKTGSQRDSDSGSGADSGFGEDHDHDRNHDRPHPRKGTASVVSFADAPSVGVQAAHTVNVDAGINTNPDPTPQLCVVIPIPTPFDDGGATSSNTPVSAAGTSVDEVDSLSLSPILAARVGNHGDGDGIGGGDGDTLSRSSPVPLAGIALLDSLPLADGGGEGGEESTAWELSSSSGDDGPNVVSAVRSRSRSKSRSRSDDQKHEQGRGQATSPASPPPPDFSSSNPNTHTHTRPESPGSYVARMQRILAQVQHTTSDNSTSTGRSPDKTEMETETEMEMDTARTRLGRNSDVIGGAAVVGGAVASRQIQVVREPSAAPLDGSGIQHCCETGDEDGREAERQPQLVGVEQRGPCNPAVVRGTELEGKIGQQEGLVYGDAEEAENLRDVEVLIAAVSAMIGMMIPERYRWVLWLACSAVTLWFPLKNQLSFSTVGWPISVSWRSSVFAGAGDGDETTEVVPVEADQGPPPKYVDLGIDVNVNVGGAAGFAGVDADVDVDPTALPVCAGGDREKMAVNEAEQGHDGGSSNKDLGEGRERTATSTEGLTLTREQREQYGEVLAGLSKTELEFVKSAGEEEEMRLIHQCLEYANYDTAGAIKVCGTFCRFRMKEGWALVLSAQELEGPLRTRVHTVTAGRDRIGRGMITFSPGKLDMDKSRPAAYHKMLCYVLQEVLKEEELQTKGLVLLVDARDVGFSLLRHFTVSDYTRGLRMLGGAFPAKVKAIRILHLNRTISIALSIAMPLLSAKMRARVEIVTSDRAGDGSFTNELAEPSLIPTELGIQGKWTGSHDFWGKWVEERISAERRLAR